MNNSQYPEKNRFFYAVVALSVLSVLAASVGIWYTAKKIRSDVKAPTQTGVSLENRSDSVSDTQANKRETGVADDRTTESEETSESTTEETTDLTTKAAATTERTVDCTLPLSSNILKDYSNGTMVKSKTMNDWRTHNGVDFTGEQGDEIHAVCGGEIREVTADPSWGNVVVIEHENGLTARYCGLENVDVNEGQYIAGGEKIGTLGIIPIESADAVHLHFETVKDGEYVDPVQSLSIQREE